MNDSDEDGEALRRLSERMKESNVAPPDASEVAPAALYLTAILECVSRLLALRSSLTTVRHTAQVYMRVSWTTSASEVSNLMHL